MEDTMSLNCSRISSALVVAAAALMVAALPASAQQRRAAAQVGPYCVGSVGALFDEIEPTTLSDGEISSILFLREEEKLARDVYLTLADRWQLPIFATIASSEQRHMDLVLRLIVTYELLDPVVDDAVGSFTDPNLGDLFVGLTQQGELSLVDALIVGATIEDMDLAELMSIIESAANDHLKLVAYNLAKGSRNHLRAFVRALSAQDAVYIPQYLDPSTFDAIVGGEAERRTHYDANGEPVPACGQGLAGISGRRGPGQGGQGNVPGDGQCGGSEDCDGTGPHGGGQGPGEGAGRNGTGDCDGTGPHGGGQGHGDGGD
jgi:hypothetical protein